MALPLLAIGAATSVAGTLLNAYSQYAGYQEQKATSKYNQAIIDANNRIDSAMIEMDKRRIRREGESLLGTQRAMVGKSGTTFSGSNIDVFMDSLKDIELDIITLDLQKMAKSASASQASTLEQMGVDSARRALPLQIGGTLLGGASKVAGMYSTPIAQKVAGSGGTS